MQSLIKCPALIACRHACGGGGCLLLRRGATAQVLSNQAGSTSKHLCQTQTLVPPITGQQICRKVELVPTTVLSARRRTLKSPFPPVWQSPKLLSACRCREEEDIDSNVTDSNGSRRQRCSRRLNAEGFTSKRAHGIQVFIADFDETCTKEDTSFILAKAAIRVLEGDVSTSSGGDSDAAWVSEHAKDKWNEWLQVWRQYEQEYNEVVSSALEKALSEEAYYLSSTSANTSQSTVEWTTARRRRALKVFSEGVRQFLDDSVVVLAEAKTLAGIPLGAVSEEVARSASLLRTGCTETLSTLIENRIPVRIASLNFSKELIRAALGLDGIEVHANELVYKDGVSTGVIEGDLNTPTAKDALVESIIQSVLEAAERKGQREEQGSGGLVVFIGDSTLDLLALSKADVGIVIGQSRGLKKVIDALGFEVQPLSDACGEIRDARAEKATVMSNNGGGEGKRVGKIWSAAESGILYKVQNWTEVQELVEATSSPSPMSEDMTNGSGALLGSTSLSVKLNANSVNSVSSASRRIPACQPHSTGGCKIGTSWDRRMVQFSVVANAGSSRGRCQPAAALAAGAIGLSKEETTSEAGRATGWLSSAFLPFTVALCEENPEEAVCKPQSLTTASKPLPTSSSLSSSTVSRSFACAARPVSSTTRRMRSLACFALSSSMPNVTTVETEDPVPHVPCVLTVAGSDSGAGAGIQADLKACAALGAFCSTAITAITAQNTVGVQGIHPVPASFIRDQMVSVLTDIKADVVKTGMLLNGDVVCAVCDTLRKYHRGAVVVDPVLVATSGDALAEANMLDSLRSELIPLADIVTPNLHEASVILGGRKIADVADMRAAAEAIFGLGCKSVLVKGGHLSTDGSKVDVFFNGEEWHELHALSVDTKNTHGTGCTLAAAIAAGLAKGLPILTAVQQAKSYVTEALTRSVSFEVGQGPQGPINHLFALPEWSANEKLSAVTMQPSPQSPRARFKAEHLFLYAVTSADLNKKWGRSMVNAISGAIEGGATFLQLRLKDADTLDFLKDAEEVVKLARQAGVPLLINDRIDIALATDADGVHIGQSDMPVSIARKLLGPDKIIGVSAKTPEQAKMAAEGGADYLGSGAVYPTTTKVLTVNIGVDGLVKVCQSSILPVVAIGGITSKNVAEVMKTGLPSGVAIISAIFDQPDVAVATWRLRETLEALRR